MYNENIRFIYTFITGFNQQYIPINLSDMVKTFAKKCTK